VTPVYNIRARREEKYPLPKTIGSDIYYRLEMIRHAIQCLDIEKDDMYGALRNYERQLIKYDLSVAIKMLNDELEYIENIDRQLNTY
jgi:hypothetical protein